MYFSESDDVELEFQKRMNTFVKTEFMGKVTHFLGIKFIWQQDKTDHTTTCHLSQQAFTDNILHYANLDPNNNKYPITPYRSGKPVDSITHKDLPQHEFLPLQQKYRSIIGSLNWLAHSTRPDLSTITSILTKYQNKPSPGHLYAAQFALKYLAGTRQLGLLFTTNQHIDAQTFIHFPLNKLTSYTDSNWGPQDASKPPPNTKETVDLFKTRSISGHIILLHGPLHWLAKRQKSTAQSTAEAEIYSTNECVKDLLNLQHIIHDLNLHKFLTPGPTPIFNDNTACVQWCHNKSNRSMRHIQIRENLVREAIQRKRITVTHVAGKSNPADIFTKEMKDSLHFIQLRNFIIYPPPKLQPLLQPLTKSSQA